MKSVAVAVGDFLVLLAVLFVAPLPPDEGMLATVYIGTSLLAAAALLAAHRWVGRRIDAVGRREIEERERLHAIHFNRFGPWGSPQPRSRAERSLFSYGSFTSSWIFSCGLGALWFLALALNAVLLRRGAGSLLGSIPGELGWAVATGAFATFVAKSEIQGIGVRHGSRASRRGVIAFFLSLAAAGIGCTWLHRSIVIFLRSEFGIGVGSSAALVFASLAAPVFMSAVLRLWDRVSTDQVKRFVAVSSVIATAEVTRRIVKAPTSGIDAVGPNLGMLLVCALVASSGELRYRSNWFGCRNLKATTVTICGVVVAYWLATVINELPDVWITVSRQAGVIISVFIVSKLRDRLAAVVDEGYLTSDGGSGNEWGGNRNYYNNQYAERAKRRL